MNVTIFIFPASIIMSYLEDDPLVYGELGDDVGEQQVTMVPGGRVHTVLGQETGPGVGHQSPQLVALFLVGSIVDVGRALVHQETRELQQQDPDIVTGAEWVLGIDDELDEGRDNVCVVFIIRSGRGADQLVSLAVLK